MSKQFLYRKQDGINRYYEKRLPINMIEELNLSYIGEKDIDFGSDRLNVSKLFKQNFRNTQQAYRWFTVYFKKNNTNQYMKNHASYIRKEYYYNEHLAPPYFEYLMKHNEFQVIDWKYTINKGLSIEGYWLICKKETNSKDIDIISDNLSEECLYPNFTFDSITFRPYYWYKNFFIDIILKNNKVYGILGNNQLIELSQIFREHCNRNKHQKSFAFDWFESKLRNFKACYFTGTELSFKINPIKWIDKQKKVIEIIFRNMLKQEIPNYPERLLEIYIQTQFKIVDKNIQRNKYIWVEQQTKGIPF